MAWIGVDPLEILISARTATTIATTSINTPYHGMPSCAMIGSFDEDPPPANGAAPLRATQSL